MFDKEVDTPHSREQNEFSVLEGFRAYTYTQCKACTPSHS